MQIYLGVITDKQDSRIFSNINWALVNGEWLDQMLPMKAKLLPEGVSDHCPIMAQYLQDVPQKRRSFKYCNLYSVHLNLSTL